MKIMTSTLALLLLGSVAHAGNPPTTTCSNVGGTIEIANGVVTILTTKYPADIRESYSIHAINVVEKTIQKMPTENVGCTSRTVVFKQITLTQKDGLAMPNAYNLLAQDGSLNDYFVCATSSAWMARPGQTCN